MANAVISRGGTSVSVPLLADGDTLAVARDVGKPTVKYHDVGREDPLPADHLNAGDAFTFTGLLHGSSAYSDAKTLAESLIKARATTGTPLQLDLSALPNKGTYDVAPITSSAITLAYAPGRTEMVGVQATLNAVEQTIGGSQTTQTHSSPDAGSGIKLTDGVNPVTLTSDLEVVRKVGRPKGKLNPRPADLPTYIDENAPASDTFEISGELTSGSAEADATTLEEDLVRSRKGQDALTLHFQSGLFGLDAYDVMPEGSQAVRTVFKAGHKGDVEVPKLALRVVDTQ